MHKEPSGVDPVHDFKCKYSCGDAVTQLAVAELLSSALSTIQESCIDGNNLRESEEETVYQYIACSKCSGSHNNNSNMRT